MLSLTVAQPIQPFLSYKVVSDAQHPFEYYVDSRPARLDVQLTQNAVERAWGTWNAVTCATPKTRSKGPAGGTVPSVVSTLDDYSVAAIFMQTYDADAQEIFGTINFVTSVSIPRAYGGVLQTCDMFFNAFSEQWSLDAVPPTNLMDVETVTLHEAGHCLGLAHFGPNEAVMFQVVEPGQAVRVLTTADIDYFCQRNPLYGAEGAPCQADGGCEVNLKCLAQPQTNGVVYQRCSKGCAVNTAAVCEVPLTCQASSAFAGFSGACLLPGTATTRVGAACSQPSECGNSFATCRRPEAASGGHQFWVDGYCTQRCEVGDPACPANSVCVQLDTGHQCAQVCRVGYADCRPEYACAPIDAIGTSGVCIPRCYSDMDCADPVGTTCRTCDGLCVNRQNVSGQIGDLCNDSSSCGSGQDCRVTDSRSNVKQCTQQCARGCGACPTGSTCTPGNAGELFCLKDCTGPGTCPNGLRCADTVVGKSCQPACNNDPDCPVGQYCYLGECYTPQEDAGCGTLCNKPDGGKPIVITPKDGGTGIGGTGGCGCQSVDSAAVLMLAAVVLGRRRRKS